MLITDEEIQKVVDHIGEQGKPSYEMEIHEKLNKPSISGGESECDEDEELIEKCIEVIRSEQRASASLMQRRLRLGYNRASRIIDELERRGVVGLEREPSLAKSLLTWMVAARTAPGSLWCGPRRPECLAITSQIAGKIRGSHLGALTHLLHERFARLDLSTHGENGFPFGVIVGHHHDRTIRQQPMSHALDHMVGGLISLTVEDFKVRV